MKRGGFALPLALAVMVAVSILAVTSLRVALVDLQANRGARVAARALYAAEGGAQHTLATWDTGPWSSLAPGDSASSAWVTLPDGSRYQSMVLRVDDGSDTPLYRVLTEGRPSRGSTARRQLLTMVTGGGGNGASFGVQAAATVRGRLRIRGDGRGNRRSWRGDEDEGRSTLDGRDHVPSSWAGSCPARIDPEGGVVVERSRDLQQLNGAEVEGDPPVTEVGRLDDDMTSVLGTTTWDALTASASIVFPRNTRIRDEIRPRSSGGMCDTSEETNWGAPELPGSVCWTYLPTIYVDGNLRIDDGSRGQGVLLVEGNLEIRGEFRFYGMVVVRGRLLLRDESVITGAVIVAGGPQGNRTSQVRDGSRIRFSSCSLARAGGDRGGVQFLDGRHWFELP